MQGPQVALASLASMAPRQASSIPPPSLPLFQSPLSSLLFGLFHNDDSHQLPQSADLAQKIAKAQVGLAIGHVRKHHRASALSAARITPHLIPGTVCWRQKPNHAWPVRHGPHGYQKVEIALSWSEQRHRPRSAAPFNDIPSPLVPVLAQKCVGSHVVFPLLRTWRSPSYF
jgi:hypothetical protein